MVFPTRDHARPLVHDSACRMAKFEGATEVSNNTLCLIIDDLLYLPVPMQECSGLRGTSNTNSFTVPVIFTLVWLSLAVRVQSIDNKNLGGYILWCSSIFICSGKLSSPTKSTSFGRIHNITGIIYCNTISQKEGVCLLWEIRNKYVKRGGNLLCFYYCMLRSVIKNGVKCPQSVQLMNMQFTTNLCVALQSNYPSRISWLRMNYAQTWILRGLWELKLAWYVVVRSWNFADLVFHRLET